MGLDGVELVMEVEDRFRVKLPDAECGSVRTVADLAALVISRLPRSTGACPAARSFFSLRKAIVQDCDIERRLLKPGTPLDAAFPRPHRRSRWKRVAKLEPLMPRLAPTETARRSFAAIGWLLLLLWVASLVPVVLELGMTGGMMLGGILALGAVAFVRAKDFIATEFPAECTTLGDLARAISPQTLPLGAGDRLVAEQRVLEQVRTITAEQLGLRPDQVKPESRFVDDLGMG